MSRASLLGVFLSISILLYGQSTDQKISISFENEPLESALLKLDGVVERQLSYNPQILPSGVVLNQSFDAETPENILADICFQRNYTGRSIDGSQ